LSHGDECIVFRPTFPVYEMQAGHQGAQIIHIDLEPKTFAYDVDEILAAVTPKTRLVYLCSPNNPTGSLFKANQLAGLLAGLPGEVLLVYDEVYYHFVNAVDRPDPLEYVLSGANLVVVHSFSKAYGLAGLRLGYAIGSPENAGRLSSIRRPFHLSSVTFEAGMAAIADQAHVAKTVEVTLQGRDWLYGQLQELDLTVWPSQGNFLLFQCAGPAAEWAEQLQEYGIIVRPAFGLPDCLRVTIGLPEANQALVAALDDILSTS
jgi:histidinol-phosphate aminotransferase